MSKIILQPTANKVAYEHYMNTILNPVSINVIKNHVDIEIYNQMKEQYPDGNVYVWGVKNGEKDTNKKKWEKIVRVILHYFQKKVVFLPVL